MPDTQRVSAERTVTLLRSRSVQWTIEGTLQNYYASDQLRLSWIIDGSERAAVYPAIGTNPGPGAIAANGVFDLEPGTHTIRVEFSQVARPSLSVLHASLFVLFDPPLAYQQSDYQDGFQLACYRPEVPFPPAARTLPDFQVRGDLRALADVLALQYVDQVAAELAAAELLGPGTVLANVPNSGDPVPGTIIASYPPGCVVWISGTTNNQQLALSAAGALLGPVSVGGYATSLSWLAASNVILDRMQTAGIGPLTPIVLLGHSYGGALASIVAARLRRGQADRRIDLVTFGCPIPGDLRLAELLLDCRSLSIGNVGDPVPSMPPQDLNLRYIAGPLPGVFLFFWADWHRPINQALLFGDGTLLPSGGDTVGAATIIEIALELAAALPVPPFAAHAMAVYAARLAL